jgi:hypothetical protein
MIYTIPPAFENTNINEHMDPAAMAAVFPEADPACRPAIAYRTGVVRSDGWTRLKQVQFLDVLSYTGCVTEAARAVGMSTQSAYRFRHQERGIAVHFGWMAALLMARHQIADRLFDQALNGVETRTRTEQDQYSDGDIRIRTTTNPRLSLGLLDRLERFASMDEGVPDRILAQMIAQDFDSYIDALACTPMGGERMMVARFADAKRGHAGHYGGMCETNPLNALNMDHLPEKTGPEEPVGSDDSAPSFEKQWEAALTPEEEPMLAKIRGVWWDDKASEYRTDFPYPADADEYTLMRECEFGDEEFERALTPEEAVAQFVIDGPRNTHHLPEQSAKLGEAMRVKWFAFAKIEGAMDRLNAAQA